MSEKIPMYALPWEERQKIYDSQKVDENGFIDDGGIEVVGRKDDTGKLRWDLLPWGEIYDVVGVLTYGAEKYGPNNWQDIESPENRYLAAAHRHLFAWWSGEKKDPDTGYSHLAHAVCCLLFLMWFEKS